MSQRHRLSLVVAAGCTALLAACSGGGSAAAPSTTSTTSTSETAAATTADTSAAASSSADTSSAASGSATDQSSTAVSSGSIDQSSSAPTGPVVKLSMLTGFTGPDKPAYDALIAEFNKTHPNIQVTMDVQPWDTIGQKLPAAWATGQTPDLATPNFDPGIIFRYIRTKSVLPLDDAVGTGDDKIEPRAWPDTVKAAFTVDGRLYAAPANLATLVLYYNKDMFTKAGITAAPTTQDEFIADAKKLTDNGVYGLSLADHATIQMWPILQWMNGGDVVDNKGCGVNAQDKSVQALQTWARLVAKDKISPVGQTGGDADTLFSAKKAAMEINGPWAAAGYRKAGINLGIAQVPVGPGGPVTLASTVPLLIGKGTQHAAEAKTFLAWWTSKTAQAMFSKQSGFPPVRTDMADAVASNPTVKVFADALPNGRLYLAGQEKSAQIDSDAYVPMIGKITRGEDVAASAKAADEAIDGITGCSP